MASSYPSSTQESEVYPQDGGRDLKVYTRGLLEKIKHFLF